MRQYKPSIQRVDAQVGRLLGALADAGVERNTLVIIHADHGQNLLDHGTFGHGQDLYDASLRVPLVMRWPGHLPAGQRVDGLVRLVDVYPTVAELAGLGVPAVLDGRSLVGLA